MVFFGTGPSFSNLPQKPDMSAHCNALTSMGWLFRCLCTRATLSERGSCGQDCEYREISDGEPHSLRVKTHPERLPGFEDRFLGEQSVSADTIPKDFIVKRRDGLYAYQLAAAIDDAQPHFTHIVRGADLLDSTYRQRWLQQLLKLEAPAYGHVPVVLDEAGNKLSKQTGAAALDSRQPEDNLRAGLRHLGQAAPPSSARSVAEILSPRRRILDSGKIINTSDLDVLLFNSHTERSSVTFVSRYRFRAACEYSWSKKIRSCWKS